MKPTRDQRLVEVSPYLRLPVTSQTDTRSMPSPRSITTTIVTGVCESKIQKWRNGMGNPVCKSWIVIILLELFKSLHSSIESSHPVEALNRAYPLFPSLLWLSPATSQCVRLISNCMDWDVDDWGRTRPICTLHTILIVLETSPLSRVQLQSRQRPAARKQFSIGSPVAPPPTFIEHLRSIKGLIQQKSEC